VTLDGSEANGRDPDVAIEPELLLLRRIAGGDRAAFHDLFEAYYRRLSRFCTRLLNDPQLVEEVVNDTLMVAWRKAESFSARSRVSTWIFGIAYRLAMKALASRQLRAREIGSDGAMQAEAGSSIDTQLEDAEVSYSRSRFSDSRLSIVPLEPRTSWATPCGDRAIVERP
jgi:RNA polymerase sigma-70 factor (ECF subfamily)